MTVSNVNVSAATLGTYIYTATGGETSKSGADDNGATLSYTPGKELVHINGALMVKNSDYTATDGSSITLTTALIAGDVLEIVSFSPFSVATALPLSTVTTKGDIIAATGSGTVTNLAVGSDGSTLVANSAASTGVSWAGQPYANPVLNSAFQVWQRGTSVSLSASSAGVYTADRWCVSSSANQAMTVSRQATSDTTNLPNIQYCTRVQRNSGQTGTSAKQFGSSFESINSIPYAGKVITLSFYARAGANYSASSNALIAAILTGTGTDQNYFVSGYTGAASPIYQTTTLTTTWQRFSYTATIATTATELSISFIDTPTGTAGTNDYYEVTGVQIDLGSVALPFRTYAGTIAGELAACQRYYWRRSGGQYQLVTTSAVADNSTQTLTFIQPPVPMRVAPTSMDVSNVSFYKYDESTYSLSSIVLNGTRTTESLIHCYATASGLTAGWSGAWVLNSTGYLGFSAEL